MVSSVLNLRGKSHSPVVQPLISKEENILRAMQYNGEVYSFEQTTNDTEQLFEFIKGNKKLGDLTADFSLVHLEVVKDENITLRVAKDVFGKRSLLMS